MLKRCPKCNIKKSVSEFHHNRAKKDGCCSWCKECQYEYSRGYRGRNKDKIAKQRKEHYSKNKVRIAKQRKEHYSGNKDKILKQNKKYRSKNKDKITKQRKGYYSKNRDNILKEKKEYHCENRERILKTKKRYYNKNRDKIIKQIRKYYSENKDKVATRTKEYQKTPNGKLIHTRSEHNRRAYYENERSDITPALWDKIIQSQGNKCNVCHKQFTKKRPPTQDHIVPLSKGGSVYSHNIQALCLSCNSSKHAKLDNSYIQTWAQLNS